MSAVASRLEHAVRVAQDVVWKEMGYFPHEGQRQIHEAFLTARHRVAVCGRRFGKSTAGGHELYREWVVTRLLKDAGFLPRPRRFWIVGPNYDDCEKEFRVLWEDLKANKVPLEHPGTYYNPVQGLMAIRSLDGDLVVECRSATNPQSLDGEGLDGVVLSEAAKLKPSVWLKYIRPALADKEGWSLMASTPEGKNWLYDKWRDGQDPNRPDWASWRLPSWLNSQVFPGGREDPEILAMAADLSRERFSQQVAAEFTDFVGRVFADFDEEIHLADLTFDPNRRTFAACDYGFCVDTETEILTHRGWKRLGEFDVGEMTLGINVTTGLASWQPILDVSQFPGVREMRLIEQRGHSSLTTPNHRWPTISQSGYRQMMTTESLRVTDSVPCAAPVVDLPQEAKYSDSFVELVAWYWTEGSKSNQGPDLTIWQNEGAHADRIRGMLTRLCGKAGITRHGNRTAGCFQWCESQHRPGALSFRLNRDLGRAVLSVVHGSNKIVSIEFVCSLTHAQLQMFVDVSLMADGFTTNKGTRAISQSVRERLDVFQVACSLLGLRTSITRLKNHNRFGAPNHWLLVIHKSTHVALGVAKQTRQRHDGIIWCPTTPSGTWLARRNGSVYFTGNTNPFVWLVIQVDVWDNVYVLDEYRAQNLTIEEIGRELKARDLGNRVERFFPDPASPGDTRYLEQTLRLRSGGGTGGELKDRLELIRRFLKLQPEHLDDAHPEKQPKIFFDRTRTRELQFEMSEYRYPDEVEGRSQSELPKKENDHGPEALGRFFAGVFRTIERRGTRVSKARVSRT